VTLFVDIRADTLNIDETLIEQAITSKTKAIVVVHYAGVGCEMDAIMAIAKKHNLIVIEDAAQGVMSAYKGRALGAIGHLGCYSFHETKNVISGEGGALLINDEKFIERAEIIREKGTDRSRFFRGQVDKYTWCDLGSSFLPGEITAAFLYAQLEESQKITDARLKLWQAYHDLLASLEEKGLVRRPLIGEGCEQNAHMYYVHLDSTLDRNKVLEELRESEIYAVFHYVPLHSSEAGLKFGRCAGDMKRTDALSSSLIRLPMWLGLTYQQQERVVDMLNKAVSRT
jgi:dTDP-4-amino-4,6-dideoxygalactose transaminase